MEKYISILLFIAPGFLARTLVDQFTYKDEIKGELEKTLISLLYGLPIFLITGFWICLINNVYKISELKKYMNNILFIGEYAFFVIIVTLLVSIIIIIYELKFEKRINRKIRKIFKLPSVSDNKNGWKEFFEYTKKPRIISIHKDGKEISIGVLKNHSISNSKKSEIILEGVNLIEERRDYFNEIEKVYIDLEKEIVIKEHKQKIPTQNKAEVK